MEFYFDPGYGNLMSDKTNLTYIQNDTYSPYSGVAFTGENRFVSFNVPLSGINEYSSVTGSTICSLHLKLSVYCQNMSLSPGLSDCFSVGFTTSDSPIYMDYCSAIVGKDVCEGYIPACSGLYYFAQNGNFDDGLHHISLALAHWHMTAKGSRYRISRYSFDIDGNIADNFYKDSALASTQTYPKSFGIWFPPTSSGTFYVSGIFIEKKVVASQPFSTSAAECIPSMTQAVRLPTSNLSTDFLSVGDGEYVGNTAGQTLLSTIDAGENSDVITKFGATSKVSHIVTYGNPGYRVGSNIETAYGISQSGNDSITAHGSCSLSADADASAFVAWEADSGTKLSDLDGLKVGWQV